VEISATAPDRALSAGLCSSMLMHGAAPESHGHNFNFLILPKMQLKFAATPGQSEKCVYIFARNFYARCTLPKILIFTCVQQRVYKKKVIELQRTIASELLCVCMTEIFSYSERLGF
jgi:hypothetical protein